MSSEYHATSLERFDDYEPGFEGALRGDVQLALKWAKYVAAPSEYMDPVIFQAMFREIRRHRGELELQRSFGAFKDGILGRGMFGSRVPPVRDEEI